MILFHQKGDRKKFEFYSCQTWDYCLAAELITMSCGVLFFLAFFLAMYVEVKARNTVYQLICKFFHLNNDW